ncbi:uncharacterized protein BJ171DRAFT_580717 [Polychytrium aggregatum]|uniref:uncharacterized protein n=1 Tax=Polychytrium aggregatum TaxID=110093 RepID=UPI0022FE515E|nr:uncharacterized protein BJ171DRAFT_580717 [Polychytrium aggregatum]KAI9205540.1 hypothetical protein BJ171DRAFT_580717 [Polychytrium aggregatum]
MSHDLLRNRLTPLDVPELLYSTLYHLPVKTLAICRRVSRLWRACAEVVRNDRKQEQTQLILILSRHRMDAASVEGQPSLRGWGSLDGGSILHYPIPEESHVVVIPLRLKDRFLLDHYHTVCEYHTDGGDLEKAFEAGWLPITDSFDNPAAFAVHFGPPSANMAFPVLGGAPSRSASTARIDVMARQLCSLGDRKLEYYGPDFVLDLSYLNPKTLAWMQDRPMGPHRRGLNQKIVMVKRLAINESWKTMRSGRIYSSDGLGLLGRAFGKHNIHDPYERLRGKAQFLLRKQIFMNSEGIADWSALSQEISSSWTDRLMQFMDVDFKIKQKQIQIVNNMQIGAAVRDQLALKLKRGTVDALTSLPLGICYLRRIGYAGDCSNPASIFDYLSAYDPWDYYLHNTTHPQEEKEMNEASAIKAITKRPRIQEAERHGLYTEGIQVLEQIHATYKEMIESTASSEQP